MMFGCFTLFFIFQNSNKAVGLETTANVGTKVSTPKAQTYAQTAKANSNSNDFQWITLTVLLTGGFVTCGGFVVKQLVEAKDAVISAKDSEIKRLQSAKDDSDKIKEQRIEVMIKEYESRISNVEKYNEALKEKMQAKEDIISKIVSDFNKKGFVSDTDSDIREIMNLLSQVKNYEEEIEPLHRFAAQWIRSKKNIWLDEMVQYAEDRYAQDLKDKKIEFTNDISKCLEWLYDSTFCNISKSLVIYLPKYSIDSILPYRACFKYLRQKNDIGDLKHAEANFFNVYLDELIQLL